MDTTSNPLYSATASPPISPAEAEVSARIIEEFIEAAADLYELRHTRQPISTLQEQLQQDFRIDANLDGLRVWSQQLPPEYSDNVVITSSGEMLLYALRCFESRNTKQLKQILALAETETDLRSSLVNAIQWVPYNFVEPLPGHLLSTRSPFYHLVGLEIFRQHQIRAETSFEWGLHQNNKEIQQAALNAIGEIGITELTTLSNPSMNSDDSNIRFAAARAGLLLGQNPKAASVMKEIALSDHAHQRQALCLLSVFLPLSESTALLSALVKQPNTTHLMIETAGMQGDVSAIPALIRLMKNPLHNRIAGFAISFITGLNLTEQNMEADPPEDLETGPNDNPDDEDTASDLDEDLPWPDVNKVEQWWQQNGPSFKPGTRYLMGKEIDKALCIEVLQHGFQAQREIAALHLKALDPASSLFQCDAPAWRQQTRIKQLLANV